jgi:hypothetical protein
MRLRDYIVLASDPHESTGIKNRILRRVAIRAGLSVYTVYEISIGRRFASEATAFKIHHACDGHVKMKEVMRHERKKPGPKSSVVADRG